MRVRNLVATLFASGFWFCQATPSGADAWPSRPLTLIAPFAAGGSTDTLARILATRLGEVLGQQVVVENVGGAGGMNGAYRVAKAAPDGYQFVLGNTGNFAQNQTLYRNPLYNAASDFTPVALVTEQPILLTARKDLPADNLPAFIAYTKANQAKMQYGSAGTGSTIHLACVLLNSAMSVDVTHVPYRGGAQAVQDLLAGRIDYMCPNSASAMSYVQSKSVKAIAILSAQRSRSLPEVATAHEQGLKDFAADSWNGIFLPKHAPAAIVQKLHDASVAALNTPAVQERLAAIGVDVVAPERRSPEYLQQFVVSEIEKWGRIIKATGVVIN